MIDAKLQQSLRERFNPEGSMLRRQQLRMLEILLYVDRVCKEHNIRYWLSSGTSAALKCLFDIKLLNSP